MTPATFDLDGYLRRVGLAAVPAADLDGLAAVQDAQLRAVPFENFDVLLDGRVDVEPTAIFGKLVAGGRGGYCFECNILLREALCEMGFDARLALGRVVLDREADDVPPRTHAIVVVRIDGEDHAVDCGFVRDTMRGVLRLPDGVTEVEGGGSWRVRPDERFGLRVVREVPGRPPRDLYVFDLDPVYPADLAVANHWTSTHPSSHFTRMIRAVRHTENGRVALDGRTLIERGVDGVAVRSEPLGNADELLRVIRDELRIPLDATADRRDRLWSRATAAS